MNSRGGRVGYVRSGFRIGFEGMVIRGEDMLFTFDGMSDVHPITDPSQVVSSIIRQLGWAKETATVETKPMRARPGDTDVQKASRAAAQPPVRVFFH